MGFTLTDFLYFGSALPDNVDSGALRIFRKDVLRWGVVAHIVEVVVSGIPPLQLLGAVEDSLSELKAFGGTALDTVPSEYTQLDYITFSGTQYIETDLSGAARWVGAGQGTSDASGSKCILGALTSSGNASVYLASRFGSNTGATYKRWTIDSAAGSTSVSGLTYAEYDIDYQENTFAGTINAESTSRTNTDTFTTWLIGCSRGVSGGVTTNYPFVGNIYEQKAYQNNVLVGDFIPVKRKSDGVIGMYDAVSGKFYTNAGSGYLLAGNEVLPTPSDPMDIYCNNGKISVLDHTNWNVITNPTSQTGQGMFINSDGKLQKANDRGAGVFIPVTVGKKYTLLINKKTTALGTIIRYGQSNNGDLPNSAEQLLDWYRGAIEDTMMISFTAKRPYFVMQLAASLVEAGGIDEAVEVIEAAGDNETLAIRTRNLANVATDIDGKYIAEDGTIGTNAASCYSDIIPVVAGETYTWSCTCGNSGTSNNKRIHAYVDGVWQEQIWLAVVSAGATWSKSFTVPAGCNGVRISHWNTDTNTQVELGSPKTAYVEYNASTAGVANLLKIASDADTHEILTGAINHKIGIRVLDGTEDWTEGSTTSLSISKTLLGTSTTVLPSASTDIVCTHYQVLGTSAVEDAIWVGASNVNFRVRATYATISDWKTYLAGQYAAGTPVIIMVPLATPFEEPAPIAQSMTVVDGDNVLDIVQAGMSGLEVSATYTAGVSVTITEIENANIGNDVDVVIA